MKEESRGGYRYVVSEEQILEWMEVPVEEKLRWVEEVAEMAYEMRTPEAGEIFELLRRGSM
jgi:hypothetical protein